MIDQQQFRDLMAGVCSPVTVVTTTADGTAYGATVSSFASLSLDPPLVSVAFGRDSRLLGHIQAARRFGVNILGQDQDDLAIAFARHGADRFADTHWFAEDGLPRLADAPGWMVCDLHQTVDRVRSRPPHRVRPARHRGPLRDRAHRRGVLPVGLRADPGPGPGRPAARHGPRGARDRQGAINILLSAHGAASFADVNPLQRIWRDSSVAARHAVVLPVVGYEVYGKALLGREDQITPLV